MELLADAEKVKYQKGWDRVFAKHQGTVLLTPTEASSVIFQYQPQFTISCILPGKERRVTVEWPKDDRANALQADIKFPDLVISHALSRAYDRCYKPNHICHCDNCSKSVGRHPFICFCSMCKDYSTHRIKSYFRAYLFNENSGLHNWSFANVGDGHICFGNQRQARNLRQANSNFWGSAFNNSNNVATLHPISTCPNILHRYLASQHHEFQAHYTKPCKRKIVHTCTCACQDKEQHHHFLCAGCRCYCQCDCCLKQCKCICNCQCCRKSCSCPCRCDLRHVFVDFLKTMASRSQGSVYDNGKSVVFGTHYLKAPSYCDGVFISYMDTTIASIEAKPLMDVRGVPFIVGFARQIPDNEWEVKFEDKTYVFSDREIHIL